MFNETNNLTLIQRELVSMSLFLLPEMFLPISVSLFSNVVLEDNFLVCFV